MAKRNGDDGPDFGGTTIEQLQTADRLPADLMLLKMENEQIFAIAATRGRDYEKIKADLVSALKSFPEAAVDSIYSKPVGFQKDECSKCHAELTRARRDEPPERCPNPKCNGARIIVGGQKYARNLSIRAAETLASSFGFNRTSTMVSDFGDERVKITASFTDYTNGRVHIADSICSPYYKGKNGQMMKMPEDRFLELKVKSESSKAMREATLRCIPHPLRVWYFTECEKFSSQMLTKEKVAEILTAFGALGVTEIDLGLLLGKPLKMGLNEEDRKVIVGLYVQVRDNPEDFWAQLYPLREEILAGQKDAEPAGQAGPPGTKEAAAEKSSQPVTGADLMKGKKSPSPAPSPQPSPETKEELPSGEPVPPKPAKPAKPAPVPREAAQDSAGQRETPPAAAAPPQKGPSSLQSVVNFVIQSGFEASDYEMPKIFDALKGVQNWVKVLEAILNGRHPMAADYRANPMEKPEGPEASQDAPESTGEESGPADPDKPLLPKEDAWDAAERKFKETLDKIAVYKQSARVQTALQWANQEPLFSEAQKRAIGLAAKERVAAIESGSK